MKLNFFVPFYIEKVDKIEQRNDFTKNYSIKGKVKLIGNDHLSCTLSNSNIAKNQFWFFFLSLNSYFK